MSDTLRDTLDGLLRSGTTSNPALNRLLDDYARFHALFLLVGGVFLVGSVGLSLVHRHARAVRWLSVRIWRTLIATSRLPAPLHPRRSRGHRFAGEGSVVMCLLLTVMVIANTQASLAPLALTVING